MDKATISQDDKLIRDTRMIGSIKSMQQIALLIILLFSTILAQPAIGPLQTVGGGQIDWGNKLILVTGTGQLSDDVSPAQHRLSGIKNARADASSKIINILREINITSDLTVGEAMGQTPEIDNRISDLTNDLTLTKRPRLLPDSSVQIVAELPLTGKLIEIIQPVISNPANNPNKASDVSTDSATSISQLVIDMRSLGCEFALYPRIYSEAGGQIFGPGMSESSGRGAMPVQYASAASAEIHRADVMTINGIKATGTHPCDVIISNDDANLVSKLTNLLLSQGKVTILVE